MNLLKVEEFDILLQFFKKYEAFNSEIYTRAGKPLPPKAGSANKPRLETIEEKLTFIQDIRRPVHCKLHGFYVRYGAVTGE